MATIVVYCAACEQTQTHRVFPGEAAATLQSAICGLCGTASLVRRNKLRKCGCTPDGDHKTCPVCAGVMRRNSEPGLLHRWMCSSCAYDEVI